MSRPSKHKSGRRENARSNAPRFDEAVLRGKTARESLVLKLQMFVADWRNCPRGVCRRRRGCSMPPTGCAAPERPDPVVTPEQDAQIRADLYRMIGERLAALRARGEA